MVTVGERQVGSILECSTYWLRIQGMLVKKQIHFDSNFSDLTQAHQTWILEIHPNQNELKPGLPHK